MKKKKSKLTAFLAACLLAVTAVCPVSAEETAVPSEDDSVTVSVYDVEANVTVTAYQIIAAVYDSQNGLTGYVQADGLEDAGITIADLESPSAEEITAIAAGIWNDTITELTAETLVWDGEEEAYRQDLGAGTWLILVSDSNAVIYNPMIVSNWYTDANLADSLRAGTVSAAGSFVEGSWSEDEETGESVYSGTAVYAKSSSVTVDKEITNYSSDSGHASDGSEGADYAVGGTVSFKITTQFPDYSDAYLQAEQDIVFTIADALSAGLDPVDAEDITVYVGGDSAEYAVEAAGEDEEGNTVTNYTVTTETASDGSQSITIAFTQDFIAAHGLDYVYVTYSTVLNSDAEVVGDDSADYNSNHVDIKYSSSPETQISTSETGGGDTVYVYTFSVTDEIAKVYSTDETSGSASADGNSVTVTNALAGAEFTLYTDSDCTSAYKDSSGSAVTAVSTSEGFLGFSGLEEGTYYLKETEAPAGYALNSTVYQIVIAAGYEASEDSASEGMLTSWSLTVRNLTTGETKTNTYEVSYGTVSKTYETADGTTVYTWSAVDDSKTTISASQNPTAVVDTSLALLPSTGGRGIFMLLALSALILAAGMAAFRRKRHAV